MSNFHSTNSLQNSISSWTVPKSERFHVRKLSTDRIYNIPQLLSTRSTTQGFGTKYDLMPLHGKGSPSPSAYSIKSIFEKNKLLKRGIIVGIRTKCPVNKFLLL